MKVVVAQETSAMVYDVVLTSCGKGLRKLITLTMPLNRAILFGALGVVFNDLKDFSSSVRNRRRYDLCFRSLTVVTSRFVVLILDRFP